MNAEQIERLIQFITARLDDDERLALAAAGGGRWRYPGSESVAGWNLYDEHWTIASMHTYEHETYDYDTHMPAVWNPRYVDADANGRHAARHDPVRVLRAVASKRRILTEVVARIDELDRQAEHEFGSGLGETTGESDLLLKLLAAPYDDHPDWDEAWRSDVDR